MEGREGRDTERMRALEDRINQGEKRTEEKLRVMEQSVEGLRREEEMGGSGVRERSWYMLERMERKMEMREREDRRRNIVIKGLNTEKGEPKGKVEELLRGIGAMVEIEDVKVIGGGEKGKGGMIWVRFKQLEQKKEVMQRKKELRGRKEKIEDDLTWKERRMQWMIKRRAAREEGRGRIYLHRRKRFLINRLCYQKHKGKENIDRLVVGERTESDHLPICVYI